MTEVDEYDSQINSELDKYEREIKSLAKKDYSQKQVAIGRIDKLKKNINSLIESYELEINQLDKGKQANYKDPLRQITKRFGDLNVEFEASKSNNAGQNQLFSDRSQVNPSQMTSGQLIQHGKNIQEQGLQSLANTLDKVNQGNVLADEILINLDNQIQQLDRMENTVKDTRSILNRSQKYIKYFARQIYTDKLLMTLICLIVLVVVAIIIASACGYNFSKLKDQI